MKKFMIMLNLVFFVVICIETFLIIDSNRSVEYFMNNSEYWRNNYFNLYARKDIDHP